MSSSAQQSPLLRVLNKNNKLEIVSSFNKLANRSFFTSNQLKDANEGHNLAIFFAGRTSPHCERAAL